MQSLYNTYHTENVRLTRAPQTEDSNNGRNIMIKHSLIAASIAVATLAGSASTAMAQVYVEVAPPPPRAERMPPPRHGQMWVPGHWEYRGNRYVWRTGYFIQERPGYRYREPNWVQRDGRWMYEQGRWDRGGPHGRPHGGPRGDRDHDGVPNRYDRNPNNPYQR